MEASQEDNNIFVAPVPVSSTTPIVPNIFSAYAVQEGVKILYIKVIYTLLAAVTTEMVEEILQNIASSEADNDIAFGLFVDTWDGSLCPYILPVQKISTGTGDYGDETTYI